MEEKIKTTETKVYVAFDGREFSNRRDCQVYEMEQARKNIALGYNVIEAVDAKGIPPYDGDTHDTDYWTYRWFYIKNERGVNDLIMAFPDLNDAVGHIIESVGRWVCLEYEYDDDDGSVWCYPLSETVGYVEHLQAKLDSALKPKTVTETCMECGHDVTLQWDVKKDGYKAFCPYCGTRLMLCDECHHRGKDDEYCDDCDYCAETNKCRFSEEG